MTDKLNISHYLLFVHYNVQSMAYKLGIIYNERLDFGIHSLSETWLSPYIPTNDLLLDSFNKPGHKIDSYGGVMVDVKGGTLQA